MEIETLVTIIFLFVGITFFVGGLVMLVNLNIKMSQFVSVVGFVTRKYKKEPFFTSLSETPSVYFEYKIRYFVDDREVETISNLKTQKELNVGEEVKIYYNPKNHQELIMFPYQEKSLYWIVW